MLAREYASFATNRAVYDQIRCLDLKGHEIIRINYLGVLNCTRAALAQMVPHKGGSIVSISSDASRQGEPREAVYGGMKAAINSLMKTVATIPRAL